MTIGRLSVAGEEYVPFRKTKGRGQEDIGSPLRSYAEYGWIFTLALATIFTLIIVVMSVASSARKETVGGVLVPAAGSLPIVAFKSGVVSAVHVLEGQEVRAGAPLATISMDTNVEGGRVAELLNDSALVQARALTEQTEARISLRARQADDLAIRRRGLLEEIANLRSQRELLEQQAQLARGTVERATPAHRAGFISTLQFQQWQTAVIQADLSLATNSQRQQLAEQNLRQIDVEALRLRSQDDEAKAQAKASEAQLREKETSLLAQKSFVVTAERDGKIAALDAKPGAAIGAGKTLATLLPTGSSLIAELRVPSRAIGFVEVGDDVRILYDAFPYQEFGMGTGKVMSISNAPTVAAEGAASSEPFYRIKVNLERQSVSAFGKDWPLVPGMGVSAIVVLERRTLLEWLFEPLFAARARMTA